MSDDVAGADLGADVDLAAGRRAVDALVAEPGRRPRRPRRSRSPRARSPRPGAPRRACAAGRRTSCRPGVSTSTAISRSAAKRLRRAEVVDLAARLAGAAQLDGHVLRRRRGAAPGGRSARARGQREAPAARRGDLDARVARHVGEVGDRGEHVVAALERERLAVAPHGARARQRQHDQLVLAGVERGPGAGLELEDPQAAVVPAGGLGRDGEAEALAAVAPSRRCRVMPPPSPASRRPRPPPASRPRRPAARRRARRRRCRSA